MRELLLTILGLVAAVVVVCVGVPVMVFGAIWVKARKQ